MGEMAEHVIRARSTMPSGACAPARLRRCAACMLRMSPLRGDRTAATVAAPPSRYAAGSRCAGPSPSPLGCASGDCSSRGAAQCCEANGATTLSERFLAFHCRFVDLGLGTPSTSSASDRFPQGRWRRATPESMRFLLVPDCSAELVLGAPGVGAQCGRSTPPPAANRFLRCPVGPGLPASGAGRCRCNRRLALRLMAFRWLQPGVCTAPPPGLWFRHAPSV